MLSLYLLVHQFPAWLPPTVIRGVSVVTEENDSVKGKVAGGFGMCT